MIFKVTDSLKGSMSIMQLLGPCGVLELQLELKSVTQEGYYFQLEDGDFDFELKYKNGFFHLIRNGYSVKFEACLGRHEGIYNTVAFAWAPSWLAAGSNDLMKKTDTPPVAVPVSIIREAKKQTLVPNLLFKSEEQFRQKVLDCLLSAQDKIEESKSQVSFWNFVKGENGKVVNISPKDETHVQSLIHGLIFDQMMMNSIEVVPEYQNKSGALDFCLMAQVEGMGIAKIAIEFKHAHSPKLIHGISSQLPAYMNSVGAIYGVYVVFLFKGEWFELPKEFTNKHDIDIKLNELRSNSSQPEHKNINVIVFDLAKNKTASLA